MKTRTVLPCLLCLLTLSTASAYAAGQAPQSPTTQPDTQAGAAASGGSGSTRQTMAQPNIDPAKEADIRRFLDLAGGTDAIKQVMDGMQANMKGSLVNSLPPGDYREQLVNLFFEKFRSKADTTHLIDLAVQVYDKYLSDDDIKGLIQFYSTPLGKKTLSVLPKVTVEMQSEGMQWGQTLGKDSMREVLAEHPELLKALQEAAKNNAAHQ
jgi:hypothetical protein